MRAIKKLVSETAIYGLSSIIGRVLFFLLTPIYTNTAILPKHEYGIMSHVFSISAFLLILLGYGLETAFFRYSLKEKNNIEKSYGTALTSILVSSVVFGLVLFSFSTPISQALNAGNYVYLVQFIFIIVLLDTLTSIPFAYLRATNKPIRFALLKLGGIGINIGLNLFFYLYCPYVIEKGESHLMYSFISAFYNPNFGVGYALVANISDALFKFLFLVKDYFKFSGRFEFTLWKLMLTYAWPILIVSFAGMINEVADRQLIKWFLPGNEKEVETQLGIYAACYKISIFLSLFTQAFRYAGEPFFFAQANEKDAKTTYALVLKYFTIVSLLGFLVVALNIDFFKLIVTDHSYWVGLPIVPIVLMAYVFHGMYYNMSVWYKLTDRTKLGAVVAVIGALVTLLVNVIFIPKHGYYASAWATFFCFFIMACISYFMGRKYYPIQYNIGRIVFYIVVAICIYSSFRWLSTQLEQSIFRYSMQLLGVVSFVIVVFIKEQKQLKQLFIT